MKKWLIRAGVLAAVFVAALVISSLVINRGTGDNIVDMGAPTLPKVSFLAGDDTINSLPGYVQDMEIAAMRDTITVLQKDGSLSMRVEKGGDQVTAVRYELYSMDGQEKYKEGEAAVPGEGETAEILLGNVMPGGSTEAVLKIILDTEQGAVSYYTRVVMPTELALSECLAFARDFQAKALAKDQSAGLENYLEPGAESDNTTYQTVNIHSDLTYVLWGEMQPQVLGEVAWSIKECNSVYTSLLAEYQIACADENGENGVYNISEFFRVRYAEGTIYLLDYERHMERVFDGGSAAFDENGILFGIASDEIQYKTNEKETMTAFVQERNLWLYDGENSELTKVFSFSDQEGEDVRSRNRRHTVRIISVDDKGNLAFAVCGYMNRGRHEGEVGTAVYYFSREDSAVQEKAFIASTKSPSIAQKEMGEMVYYSQGSMMLYVLSDGTLYQVDLEKDDQTVLAENLAENQYAVSEDGSMLAYRTAENEDTAAGIQVLNLESAEKYTVEAPEGEDVRPLGFINGDFVYGKISPEDTGTDASGVEISPMYEVEIRNWENKEEAKYSFTDQGIYTTDILFENNMLTFNRVQKDGERYSAASPEYVTNNEGRRETKLALETYSTDAGGTQVRFTFSDGIENTKPTVGKANQTTDGKSVEITLGETDDTQKFYVYGMGDLDGIYDRAGDAVQRAEQVSGVVISRDQAYVWEKGNRDLVHSTEAAAFRKDEGETSLDACGRYMESYGAERVDLTGCTLDQVLYVINKGCPVTALISADHAVLLTGYTMTDITYIDPDTGGEYTVGISEMENMTESAGNVFVGYIKTS